MASQSSPVSTQRQISQALQEAFICAWHVQGAASVPLAPDTLARQRPARPWWVHLQRDTTGLHDWMVQQLGMPPAAVHALLQEDTRPRCDVYDQGMLLILRAVNHDPEAAPEDMLSLRLWVAADGVLSLLRRPVLAVQALDARFAEGRGPASLGALLVNLIAALTERLAVHVETLDTELDALEEHPSPHRKVMAQVSYMRARVVRLKRYIAPQLSALQTLRTRAPECLGEHDKAFLHNAMDALQRVIETLDEMRERSSILREDLAAVINERMNRNMYTFTVLTGLFMPLTFVTGLLGVNLAGIPLAESDEAFIGLCLLLLALGVIEWLLLRRLRLLR